MLHRMGFQRLHKRADGAFGDRFVPRAFHDEVLSYGGIPMGVVDRWIAGHATPAVE